MSRNTKLSANDIQEYLDKNEVKIIARSLAMDKSDLTFSLSKGRMTTNLPSTINDDIAKAIVRLMVSEGVHARKNA